MPALPPEEAARGSYTHSYTPPRARPACLRKYGDEHQSTGEERKQPRDKRVVRQARTDCVAVPLIIVRLASVLKRFDEDDEGGACGRRVGEGKG